MSDIVEIEFEEIWDIPILKEMCKAEGWQFVEGQQTHNWYGRWVGDTQMPAGMTKADLGKCDHAIKIPGCSYEIGVRDRNGQTDLVWDYWGAGGLSRALGNDAGILKRNYSAAKTRMAAKKHRHRFTERKMQERPGWREIVIDME